MKTIYTAHATAVGGRNGHAETDDKNLVVELSSPGAASKKPAPATNPEQLFACGYAACFGSAIEHVAKQQNVAVSNVEVHSDVNLNQDDSGFSISVTLNITLPGIDNTAAEKLVAAAHQVCPYSKATKGNTAVTLKVNDQDLIRAA
jgi:Ohr subfamily peroxiredoxin